MHQQSGRQKEALLIRQANRAAMVGRLLLGDVRDWSEFLEPEVDDLANLPRRQLKSGKADVRGRLSHELMRFCDKNFVGMNVARLSEMYEEIKAFRGMELPLAEFESRFARVRPEVLKGNPAHLTICVSLWGFQLKVPEEQLARDVMEAASLADDAEGKLAAFEGLTHAATMKNRDDTISAKKARPGVVHRGAHRDRHDQGLALASDLPVARSSVGRSRDRRALARTCSTMGKMRALCRHGAIRKRSCTGRDEDRRRAGPGSGVDGQNASGNGQGL